MVYPTITHNVVLATHWHQGVFQQKAKQSLSGALDHLPQTPNVKAETFSIPADMSVQTCV